MTTEKKPMSETAVGRLVQGEIEKLKAAQAARDAAQDAKRARPSRAQAAIGAAEKFDFTVAYPLPSVALGMALIVGSLVGHSLGKIEATPMYVLWGIAVCLIPGLAMKLVRLATGLRKAKGDG